MTDQPVTVYEKLVALGLAAEDGMIVDHKAGLAVPGLALKNQRGGETANAASHDHAIVSFSGVNRGRGQALEQPIANLMPGLENRVGVAVGICVVADAAIAGPVVL